MTTDGWNGSDVSEDGSVDRALPRFALPNEEMTEPLDPSEVDATAPRPALSKSRSESRSESRSARRVRTTSQSRPESTQEVAASDILLEAYVEDPEPVSRRPSQLPPLSPLSPKDLAQIEDLLRDAPRPLPPAPPPPRPVHFALSQPLLPPLTSAPFDTPSVAPVAFGSSSAVVRAPFGAPAHSAAPAPVRASNRGVFFAVGAVAAFVACAVTVKLVRPMAALHASAPTVVSAAPMPSPSVPLKAEPSPPPTKEVQAATLATPSVPAVPTVAVDALPKASIPPDMTLLTLPPYATGHRVFLDKALLQKASSPIRLKCGEHTIKIGSSGKPRRVDLPCGREFTLP
ncbi:hypothetical protein AKJ09_10398 [Labilithrix luteola]|uniref:Uncharacterized protein n=1 Tax=Labilithrix luteola TaxID=1391654 RepID=A0A0K1QE96_9BACT|nr:hypothetical protein [Labilithrix luteola]AKV03735.1 hypothetical protein AKJ09_10398 [Labilithrix luteola]